HPRTHRAQPDQADGRTGCRPGPGRAHHRIRAHRPVGPGDRRLSPLPGPLLRGSDLSSVATPTSGVPMPAAPAAPGAPAPTAPAASGAPVPAPGDGELVLVGTPIGNLGDASPRMREAILSAHLVAAEDT